MMDRPTRPARIPLGALYCALAALIGALAAPALAQESPPGEALREDESEVILFLDGRALRGETQRIRLGPLWSGGSREAPSLEVTLEDEGDDPLDTKGDRLFVGRGRVPRAEFLALTLLDPRSGDAFGARRTPLPSTQHLRFLITPPSSAGGALTLRLLEGEGPAPTLSAPAPGADARSEGPVTPLQGEDAVAFGPWALLWTLLLGGLGLLAIRRAAREGAAHPPEAPATPAPPSLSATLSGGGIPLLPPLLGALPPQGAYALTPPEGDALPLALALALSLTDQGADLLWIGPPPPPEAIALALRSPHRPRPGLPAPALRHALSLADADPRWISDARPVLLFVGAPPALAPDATLSIAVGPAPSAGPWIHHRCLATPDGRWTLDTP